MPEPQCSHFLMIPALCALYASVSSCVGRQLDSALQISLQLTSFQRQGHENIVKGAPLGRSGPPFDWGPTRFWTSHSHNALQLGRPNNQLEKWCILGNTSMNLGPLPTTHLLLSPLSHSPSCVHISALSDCYSSWPTGGGKSGGWLGSFTLLSTLLFLH